MLSLNIEYIDKYYLPPSKQNSKNKCNKCKSMLHLIYQGRNTEIAYFFWDEYKKRWERIKDKYKLWYSKQERITLNQLAETCLE